MGKKRIVKFIINGCMFYYDLDNFKEEDKSLKFSRFIGKNNIQARKNHNKEEKR